MQKIILRGTKGAVINTPTDVTPTENTTDSVHEETNLE